MHYAMVKAVATHWPFANGAGRFIDKFANAQNFAGSGIRTATTSHGDIMEVIADDLIGKHILLSRQFDRSPINMLINLGQRGDRILDIGANIGYMSCCMLDAIAEATITCVEPQPLIVDLLAKNMERNHAGRFTVVRAALSDHAGTIQMAVDESNRGASHVVRPNELVGTTSISALKTSEFLASLDRVDLLKIDVEGHEEVILRDGQDEIARLRPRAILLEDQMQRMHPHGSIGHILSNIGYTVFGICKSLWRTKLVEIRRPSDELFNDYLAIRS